MKFGLWALVWVVTSFSVAIAHPLVLQGVDTNNFRITTFASGLIFPLGMARLPDGSLLATVADSPNIFSATGRIVRFTDTNQDGVADAPEQVLYAGLSSTQTSLRQAGNLLLVTGQGTPITILRLGATPSSALTLVGQIILTYPGSWEHQHSALGVRKTPGQTNSYDVIFQIGSRQNFAASTNTVEMSNVNIPGAAGTLAGDAIHQITLQDDGTNVTATNLLQLAAGVRNPAGFAYQPATGDLYFADNGIDGLTDPTEPLSADELDFIARTNLGGAVEFFGFPTNYTLYRYDTFVGGAGIPPLINFEPQPDPFSLNESEGANDITFAPPGFPAGVNTGVFIGFHGQFNYGGLNNEENPVVYADPVTKQYFHFILGQQPGIGHLDGLLATTDSLFVADLTTNGDLFASSAIGAGVIYQIKSLVAPPPPVLSVQKAGSQIKLVWDRGTLLQADAINGSWKNAPDAFSPLLISPQSPVQFYRAAY